MTVELMTGVRPICSMTELKDRNKISDIIKTKVNKILLHLKLLYLKRSIMVTFD